MLESHITVVETCQADRKNITDSWNKNTVNVFFAWMTFKFVLWRPTITSHYTDDNDGISMEKIGKYFFSTVKNIKVKQLQKNIR